MDPRRRVRQFLSGGDADRPPFLAMATDYTAKLAQCSAGELLADPVLFVRSFQESVAVLGLDAVVIEITAGQAAPAAAGGDPAGSTLAVLHEDLHRLRTTLLDRVALVALLPGPRTLCESLGATATPDAMDDLTAGLIRLQEYLGPPRLDAIGLLERVRLGDADVPGLGQATAALWNVARYYSLPSLLVAAEGTASLAAVGSTAVAAWSGTGARDLLAAGASAAGEPVPTDQAVTEPGSAAAVPGGSAVPPPARLAPLPAGGFYLTAGEIPPAWEVGAVRALVRQATAAGDPAMD